MSVEESIGAVVEQLEHDGAVRKILPEVEASELFKATLDKWKLLPRSLQVKAFDQFLETMEQARRSKDIDMWASAAARVLLFFREFAKIYGVKASRKIRDTDSIQWAHDLLFAACANEFTRVPFSPLDIVNFRIALSVLCWIFDDANGDIFADILKHASDQVSSAGYVPKTGKPN